MLYEFDWSANRTEHAGVNEAMIDVRKLVKSHGTLRVLDGADRLRRRLDVDGTRR